MRYVRRWKFHHGTRSNGNFFYRQFLKSANQINETDIFNPRLTHKIISVKLKNKK